MTPKPTHPTGLTPTKALVVLLALAFALMVGAPAGAVLPARTKAVGHSNGYWTSWNGTIPASSGAVCAPLDSRCDPTLLNVQGFDGSIPCVGITARLTGTAQPAHVAVYKLIPGVGLPGDAVATSYDGTLLFWAEPNSVYLVEIGAAGLVPTTEPLGYTAEVSTRDIGTGPGIGNGDLQLCAPGVWAADSAEQIADDHT